MRRLQKRYEKWDTKLLQLELNEHLDDIIHQLEILKDLEEAKAAGPERFYNLL